MLRSIASLALIALPLLVGCSSSPEESAETGDGQAATTTCTTAKYNEAFAHYRKATYGAKARLDGVGACGGLNGPNGTASDGTIYPLMTVEIADEASAAVMICDSFRATIKTSTYADPIRKFFANSLTLDSFTGDLLVIRDSQFQNWTGVEALLPGTSLSTVGMGVMNAHTRIDFKANGKINYYTLGSNADGTKPVETNVAGTYTVQKTGADKDPRIITIKHGTVTETLDLGVRTLDPKEPWTNAPTFTACKANAQPWECYGSLGPGECEV